MKLFMLDQEVNIDHDTYDAVVVAAETEEEARWIHPSEYEHQDKWDGKTEKYSTWCAVEDVHVRYLGEAAEGTEKGIILASFNAG